MGALGSSDRARTRRTGPRSSQPMPAKFVRGPGPTPPDPWELNILLAEPRLRGRGLGSSAQELAVQHLLGRPSTRSVFAYTSAARSVIARAGHQEVCAGTLTLRMTPDPVFAGHHSTYSFPSMMSPEPGPLGADRSAGGGAWSFGGGGMKCVVISAGAPAQPARPDVARDDGVIPRGHGGVGSAGLAKR